MAAGKQKVGNIKGPAPWTQPTAWAASTAYVGSTMPASCVTYGGSTYVCNTDHTSGSTFDATKWVLIAQAGTNGTSGANGTNGTNGARGAAVFSGIGAPSAAIIAGAVAGQDAYLDLGNGDTYSFT